jgi:orotidine-5'-phosphate decarboxylase
MIIDELYQRVEKNGHVCLGLDTDIEYIPKWFLNKYDNLEDAIFNFNKKIIDETIDVATCYKVQIAYYEAYGINGLKAYEKTLKYIKNENAISIADIKRGDIAKTAEMYAKAHFEGDFESDFVTLNPYMGFDSVEPYVPYIKNKEKGAFILLRTSNPGSKDIQYIDVENGERVYNAVGDKIYEIGKDCLGECGYSSIGAVVGCTTGFEGKQIRDKYESTFFLIPGYGAQGGTAEDVANYLSKGNGGIVNSSRGILLAYKKVENGEHSFEKAARNASINMRDDILKHIS